jgi:hypothetical protein
MPDEMKAALGIPATTSPAVAGTRAFRMFHAFAGVPGAVLRDPVRDPVSFKDTGCHLEGNAVIDRYKNMSASSFRSCQG